MNNQEIKVKRHYKNDAPSLDAVLIQLIIDMYKKGERDERRGK